MMNTFSHLPYPHLNLKGYGKYEKACRTKKTQNEIKGVATESLNLIKKLYYMQTGCYTN